MHVSYERNDEEVLCGDQVFVGEGGGPARGTKASLAVEARPPVRPASRGRPHPSGIGETPEGISTRGLVQSRPSTSAGALPPVLPGPWRVCKHAPGPIVSLVRNPRAPRADDVRAMVAPFATLSALEIDRSDGPDASERPLHPTSGPTGERHAGRLDGHAGVANGRR